MYNIGIASKINPWLNPTKVQQHRPAIRKYMQRFGWEHFREKRHRWLKKHTFFFVFLVSNLEMVEEKSDVCNMKRLFVMLNLVKILAAFFLEVVDELELEM